MSDSKLDTDSIYELLKKRIIHLEYEPGLVLNEVDVAEEFNTSRTPIRRVFQLLHGDKLLNIVPRFGAQVAPIDFKQMKSIFEVTRELDPFATRLAVERISDEKIKELEEIMSRLENYDITKDYQNAINDDELFHDIIFSSCDNPWLQEILTSLHYHTERLWHYCESYFDSMDLFTHSLGKVLEAVKEKDVEKAEKYTREHIDEFVLKIKKEML
ncbi:GntR family transcriptional regulator [Tissierella sp.]|uniref:GntR family transcriptional regulator n=1 Tax=Tissierella sp. TaxID=41274 RepID=UPI002856A4B6|nr:GntR family transcriptional regulator [Tissierella sp.]MDR7855838.1 GntR family transcriptional regulator [Tissierella sp.]